MTPQIVIDQHKGGLALPNPVAAKDDKPKPSRGSVAILLLILLVTAVYYRSIDRLTVDDIRAVAHNPAYLIEATHGAVATENKLCSDIGVDILKEGGNAVDAAISATFCIGVLNMFSSGIGGGGFMTVRIPPSSASETSEVFTIDFREKAPALSETRMYVKNPAAARHGGLSVGVPGELRGLEEAHRRWGSLPWAKLVEPSIALARGWKVQAELERRIKMFTPLMLGNPDWAAIFAPDGVLLREGDFIQRMNLSRTLSVIASEGADAIYKGPMADAIVEKIQATGGILTHGDLRNYSVKVDRALQGTYHGRKIYTSRPPSSGGVLLHMFNLMEHYNITEGRTGLNIHRFIEILKFGFSARTRFCDPAFNNSALMDFITTKEFAHKIFPNITDDRTHPPEYYNPEYDMIIDHGTSHTSVIDKDGMAVALTSTVNLIFGSQVMDPITGVILNDQMDDFSIPGHRNAFGLQPSPYNYPEPGKRPLSSTVPTIIENPDGSFRAAIGASGGSLIFGAVFQTLMNIDWGLDVSQAIEFSRLHDQLYPIRTQAEYGVPEWLLDDLRTRGHNITVLPRNTIAAVVQAVVSENGTIFAASDSRKRGVAAGY